MSHLRVPIPYSGLKFLYLPTINSPAFFYIFPFVTGKGKSTKGKLKRSSPSQGSSKVEKAQKKMRSDADAPDPDTRHGAFNILDYTIPRRTESVPSVEPAASTYLGYATSMYHNNTPYLQLLGTY